MNIIFATNNSNKIAEVKAILGNDFTITTLAENGINEDLPETAPTIEGNALQKARYVWGKCGCNCFADDTGLFVDELNGLPGVHSARFATSGHDFGANNRLLLKLMEGKTNRKAHFSTIIALIIEGKEYLFEGRVDGTIATECRGEEGFGYDPLFIPDGYDKTFAQIGEQIKNKISHRSRAVARLTKFLQQWKN